MPGLWDIHVYGGAAAFVWGLSRIHEPAAWMAGGAFLVALAVWRLKRAGAE